MPGMFRYRKNVAAVIVNSAGQVLLAERMDGRGWQFPQGGVDDGECSVQALYREVREEVGLDRDQVDVVAYTANYFRYTVPAHRRQLGQLRGGFRGQSQRWFLLRLCADDSAIDLNVARDPEFRAWQWVPYWYPLQLVVPFKRSAYRKALALLRIPYVRLCDPTR